MVLLRATDRVLHRLPAPAATGPSDTALGDWYVTRVLAGRQPLLLVVSSASRLALVLPARDVRSLPARLPGLVADRLQRLGVAPHVVEAEVRAMTPVVTAPTADRSVLGTMNEFCHLVPFHVSRHGPGRAGLLEVEAELARVPCAVSKPKRADFFPGDLARELLEKRWGSASHGSTFASSAGGTASAAKPAPGAPGAARSPARTAAPRAKRVCGLCGKAGKLIRTGCCNQWICDDADKYITFSFARNSCFRNHDRFTLCAYHHNHEHPGTWQDCAACREDIDTEMYVYYGTNEYNFEKLENPPAFEPARCAGCGNVIRRGYEGYTRADGAFWCQACARERHAREAQGSKAAKKRPAAARRSAQVIDISEARRRRDERTRH